MSPCSLLFCIDSNEMLIRERAPGQATPFSRALTRLTSTKQNRAGVLASAGLRAGRDLGCSEPEGAEPLASTCSLRRASARSPAGLVLPGSRRAVAPALSWLSALRWRVFLPCKVFPSLQGSPPCEVSFLARFFLLQGFSSSQGFLPRKVSFLTGFSSM